MVELNVETFCSSMGSADGDLREMALFDLQQALKSPDFRLDRLALSSVVECVAKCFSLSEFCRGVRSSAVQVVPQLLLLCEEKEQNLLVAVLCERATTQRARFGEKGYSELCGSSALALKMCCDLMALKAREDVGSWQRLAPVARGIIEKLLAALQAGANAVVRGDVYDSITALIHPFCRVLMCEVGGVLTNMALSDWRCGGQLGRRAVSFLSATSPFLPEESFNGVMKDFLDGLKGSTTHGVAVVPYLQLCEALVKACPLRLSFIAADVVCVLAAHLKCRLESGDGEGNSLGDDEGEVCNAMMRLMHLMACQYPGELSSIHETLFDQALKLVRFDSDIGADGENASREENFDACYWIEAGEQCDLECVEETSWTIRMWATRLLSSLIELSPFTSGLVSRLTPALFLYTMNGVEEVQLVAIELIQTVTRHSCNTTASTSLLLFIQGALNPLLKCLGFCGHKVPVAAAKVLQQLFRFHHNMFESEMGRVERIVSEVLESGLPMSDALLHELAALSFCLLETDLCEQSNNQVLTKLLDCVYRTLEVYRWNGVEDLLLDSLTILIRASKHAGAVYCERCVELLLSIALGVKTDAELPSALVRGTDECLLALSGKLRPNYFISCREKLLPPKETRLVAIQLLSIVACRACAFPIKPEELERVCDGVARCDRLHQRHIMYLVRNVLASGGCIPTKHTLDTLMQFVQSNAMTSGDTQLSLATLEMLGVLCAKVPSVIQWVVTSVLPTIWGMLVASSADAGSSYRSVVQSTASLIKVLCQCGTSEHRSCLMESALQFILNSALPEVDVGLLEGVGHVGEGVLDMVSSVMFKDESLLCLCLGTIGMWLKLPEACKARLIKFLSSASSEQARRMGLLAVGRAASNAQNGSLMALVVESAIDCRSSDRVLYWRVVREAALASAAHADLSIFNSVSFCDATVNRLMDNFLEDDLETAASVLGSFVPFSTSSLISASVSHLNGESDGRRVVCISIQRYLLANVRSADDDPELMCVVERALRCLDRAANVQVRVAVLQLFVAVVTLRPQLLLRPYIWDAVYPRILDELAVDLSLVFTVNLGSCTHREDRGLELRKMAFECVSVLLRFLEHQRKRSTALDDCGRCEQLMHCLVLACGPLEKGETDEDLNCQAKRLIVQLLRVCPARHWGDSLIATLCAQLKAALVGKTARGQQNIGRRELSVMHTLNCVMLISEFPPFTYNPHFQALLLTAQQNPLLPEAVRLG